MKNFTVFAVLLVLLVATRCSTAQTSTVNCIFLFTNGVYTCNLAGASVTNNENINVVITGNHLPGRNDASVQRVQITVSNIPFIIVQLFWRFQNILDLSITSGGLTRIQSSAGRPEFEEYFHHSQRSVQRDSTACFHRSNKSFVNRNWNEPT